MPGSDLSDDRIALPSLVPHCKWCAPFRLECPGCRQRFWNGISMTVGYPLHYATMHLGIQVFRDPRAEGQ